MQGVLGGVGVDPGFGEFSGIFASGSMSSVSKEDNLVLSSEDSSCPDESELELGLGLSLVSSCSKSQPASTGQYPRILTAKDFPSRVASSAPSSSTSSRASHSFLLSRTNNVSAGTKRAADSVAGANGPSQIVGWPPIRACRMNSLNNIAKSSTNDAFDSMDHEIESEDGETRMTNSDKGKKNGKDKTNIRSSYFIKVNMDRFSIGRKVDMSAHSCYETLARTLKDMFHLPTEVVIAERYDDHDMIVEAKRQSKLNESSEFVLTYEDKDGDWMLAGDVPWGMFINSVKRLRIMRNADAKGLAPGLEEKNNRQRSRPI